MKWPWQYCHNNSNKNNYQILAVRVPISILVALCKHVLFIILHLHNPHFTDVEMEAQGCKVLWAQGLNEGLS